MMGVESETPIPGLRPAVLNDDGKVKPFPLTASKSSRFDETSLKDIMAMEFEPIRWAVQDYVPDGLSVLAGRQKLGKTWLALDFAIAVGTGGCAMGTVDCETGDVLYLDLENGHRRIQRRIKMLFPDSRTMPTFDRVSFATDSPMLDDGFIACLEVWRQSVKAPRLVVIDVLQRVKPVGNGARNAYENDYAIFQELQSWATEHGIAVLALHHTKKGGADDPLEALSGSNGLSAVADTTLVLDKREAGITLYVRGRDVEEQEGALQFAGGQWTLMGQADDIRMSDTRREIISVVTNHQDPKSGISIANIVAFVNGKPGTVRTTISRMVTSGDLEMVGRGHYKIPEIK